MRLRVSENGRATLRSKTSRTPSTRVGRHGIHGPARIDRLEVGAWYQFLGAFNLSQRAPSTCHGGNLCKRRCPRPTARKREDPRPAGMYRHRPNRPRTQACRRTSLLSCAPEHAIDRSFTSVPWRAGRFPPTRTGGMPGRACDCGRGLDHSSGRGPGDGCHRPSWRHEWRAVRAADPAAWCTRATTAQPVVVDAHRRGGGPGPLCPRWRGYARYGAPANSGPTAKTPAHAKRFEKRSANAAACPQMDDRAG